MTSHTTHTTHPDDIAAAYTEARAHAYAVPTDPARYYPGAAVSASTALLALASDLRAGLHHDRPLPTPVYEHADGGSYHRIGNVHLKRDDGTWAEDAVAYRDASSPASPICVTTHERWLERFVLVVITDHE